MTTVNVDGDLFSYTDQGVGNTLVFLHGFPLNKSMWSAQLGEFARDHRVVAPDLRGHGDTTVTPGTVTMREMADDVANLLAALDIESPVTVCGLSMGGYVAWEFWRQHRTKLARLILCDTRAMADTEEVARGRHLMAAHVVDIGAKVAASAMMPKLFASRTYQQQPKLVESVRQTILETASKAIAATQRGMAERIDMTSELPNVDVPTLVLCGADDGISPPDEMSKIAKAMPNASFVEIADAGHLAPLEQPAATNEAIRNFLMNN